jgi:hypothetical protein
LRYSSDNPVARSLKRDIFEGAALIYSSGAKIHRQIELAVKQAFRCAALLSLDISAPKLRAGSRELI